MAPPLTEHVKEEPVSDVALLHDRVDHLSPDEPEPDVQEVCAHLRADDNDDPVDDDEEAKDGERDEPEPEEDVDLLVDDVEREKTERVVLLDLSRRSELVERALGHPREHVDQRVEPVLLVLLGERDDLQTEGEERPVEEAIHEKHLAWKLNKKDLIIIPSIVTAI